MNNIEFFENHEFSYLEDFESPYTFNGIPVPRATHILSTMLNEEYIARWANSLGFKHKGYKTTLDEAAEKGTLIHDSINRYIVKGEQPFQYISSIPDQYVESTLNGFNSFINWYNSVHGIEILYSELPLSCPYYGGTADLIARYNNKTYLLDFKTGKHLSFRYFLQLSAYRYILENYNNIKIDGLGIIRLDKDIVAYKDYILELDNETNLNYINQCTETFFALVNAYRYRYNNEYLYKSIF